MVIIPYIWKNKTCQKASYLPNFSPDGSSPSFLRLARLRCFRFRRLQDDGFFAPQRTDEHARWVEMKSTYGNNILKKMWFSINHHQYWNIKFPVAWLYANGQLSGVIRTLEYHNYPQLLIGSYWVWLSSRLSANVRVPIPHLTQTWFPSQEHARHWGSSPQICLKLTTAHWTRTLITY